MTKIVLLFWMIGPDGHLVPDRIEGFFDMAACEAAIDSLVEPNPADQFNIKGAFRCVEIPK
jgi:hypothetical protein